LVAEPDLCLELALHREGHHNVVGLDEAGRGSWAGPVVAAAVVLPLDRGDLAAELNGVRDSKLLSPGRRQELFELVQNVAAGVGVGVMPASFIDQHGIVMANREAMRQAVASLPLTPSYLLIDYLRLPSVELPQQGIPKGDRRHLSIAAASIIAKVTRDRMMIEMDSLYPGYGFARHKGYGTRQHRDALYRLGPCDTHRLSFNPMRTLARASETSGSEDRGNGSGRSSSE